MSDKRPFTTLNPREIKKDYPKTYLDITEWLKKCATEGNLITEEMVEAFIYGNPRFLYDYFDDMNMRICVLNNDGQWFGEINMFISSISHDSRKPCEEEIFKDAFIEREGKL